MLKQRILTALILIPLLIVTVFKGGNLVFAVVSGVFLLLAAWEWSAIAGIQHNMSRVLYVAAMAVCMVALYPVPGNHWVLPLLCLTVAGWCLAPVFLVRYQLQKIDLLFSPTTRAAVGFVLLMPPWLGLVMLHSGLHGAALVMLLFVVIWVADSGAYISGRLWGRRRLAGRISPGKTWEGVIGGLLAVPVPVVVFYLLVEKAAMKPVMLLVICVITVIFSIVGDLVESLFKRDANIKDSGNLLPGHGGVLDRIDSLTAAVPVFFVCLHIPGVRS